MDNKHQYHYCQFTEPQKTVVITLRDYMDNWVPRIAHDEHSNRLQRKFQLRSQDGMDMSRSLARNALSGVPMQPITLWGNPPKDSFNSGYDYLSIDGKTRTGAIRCFERGHGFDNVYTDLLTQTFPLRFYVNDVHVGDKTLAQVRAEHPEIAELWDNIPVTLNILYFKSNDDAVHYFNLVNNTAKPLADGEKFHAIVGPRSDRALETVTREWYPFFQTWKSKNGDANFERQQEYWVGQVLYMYETGAEDPARGSSTMMTYARNESPVPMEAYQGLIRTLDFMNTFCANAGLSISKSEASVLAGLFRKAEELKLDMYPKDKDWCSQLWEYIREFSNTAEGNKERVILKYGEDHFLTKAVLGKEFLRGSKLIQGLIQEKLIGRHNVEHFRHSLWERQDYKCAQTGKPLPSCKDGEIDHIVSVKRGGSSCLENLQLVTKEYNRSKGAS